MEILSLCPFPAAPLFWQLQPSRWVLTIVCKATYRLEPGVVAAAAEQEPLADEDTPWDGEPERSVHSPADLVPFKPRAEVVLVGSAFARNGQSVRSLVVRLSVGKLDKSIEVVCPRVRTRDGELREGKRWARASLAYERAAGGPGSDNPVGVGLSPERDEYGQLQLPSLQAPGFVMAGNKLPPPIGFGPIAATWPQRKARVARAAASDDTSPSSPRELALPRDLARAPFGEGFDPAYFQVAPADQQLDALRPDERITLENLHARHPLLVTSLPGTLLRARVELAGAPAREIALPPDTLWIDTDRGICTVVHRGKVDVEHPDQRGRVLVATTKGSQSIPWSRLAPPPAPPSPVPPSPVPSPVPPVVAPPPVVPRAPQASSRLVVPPAPVSPRVPLSRTSSPAPPPPARGSSTGAAQAPARRPSAPPLPPPAPLPPLPSSPSPPANDDEAPDSEVDIEITMSELMSRPLDETGPVRAITRPMSPEAADAAALPFQAAPAGWQSPVATPSRPGFAPLGAPPLDWTSTPLFGAPAAQAALPGWFEAGSLPPPTPFPPAPPELPPSVLPPPLLSSQAWPSSPASGAPPHAPPSLVGSPPADGSFGLLEASNAAARIGDPPSRPELRESETPPPRADGKTRPPAAAREPVVVELTWFDLSLAPLLLRSASLPGDSQSAKAAVAPAAEGDAEQMVRARVHEALSRGNPSSAGALESVLELAEEESPPAVALVLLSGTLELCLDEVEMLKALVAAASPLATSDRKLKETIDVATEALKAPMQGMPDFAQGLGARIRDAWVKANRALPPEHLTTCTERLLLEQRAYQRRELLDDSWIRALLSGAGSEAPIPTYLPARIAKRLPLYKRFAARLIAEVVYQQDQYETCHLALRGLALGRLPPRARARGTRRL